jgi:hypothetical protein
MGEVCNTLLREGGWERTSIILLQGCQASLACPSDKGRMRAKTLEWLEVVA